MSDTEVTAYSPDTDTEYEDWDALVAAEANGYVVVAVITTVSNQVSWPYVVGPYPDKVEANKARARLRHRYKKEQENHPNQVFSLFVRPTWKDQS